MVWLPKVSWMVIYAVGANKQALGTVWAIIIYSYFFSTYLLVYTPGIK